MNTSEKQFQTLAEAHRTDAHYYGDRPDWLIVFCRNRDSGVLEQSNFDCMLEALGGESDTVAIERSNHWAVGWLEYLVIDPAQADLITTAGELISRLEDYPVLDEMDLSKREHEEYCESWDSWGRSDYQKELRRVLLADFSNGISESFTDAECIDALAELSAEEIDELRDKAAQAVNWEYQSEGSGVTINIKGLADSTDTDKLADLCIEYLTAEQTRKDTEKLGAALGACPAQIKEALRIGINRVTGFQSLMQGSI